LYLFCHIYLFTQASNNVRPHNSSPCLLNGIVYSSSSFHNIGVFGR
jgi:hypothetical protein